METRGEPECSRCRNPIYDKSDILWYNNKIYCPTCYGKIMQTKLNSRETIGWIMVTIVLILSIILLISLAAY